MSAPREGLTDPLSNDIVEVGLLRLSLLALEVIEVEGLLLSLNRLPCEVVAYCLAQLVEPSSVGGEKHKHVAVKAISGRSLIKELPGCNPSWAVSRLAGMRVLRAQNY